MKSNIYYPSFERQMLASGLPKIGSDADDGFPVEACPNVRTKCICIRMAKN